MSFRLLVARGSSETLVVIKRSKKLRTKILITVVILILSLSLFGQKEKQRYTGQTIKEILELPESEIDLGLACLVLAKEVYPEIEVKNYLRMLDIMAYNIPIIVKGSNNPNVRIGTIKS